MGGKLAKWGEVGHFPVYLLTPATGCFFSGTPQQI